MVSKILMQYLTFTYRKKIIVDNTISVHNLKYPVSLNSSSAFHAFLRCAKSLHDILTTVHCAIVQLF